MSIHIVNNDREKMFNLTVFAFLELIYIYSILYIFYFSFWHKKNYDSKQPFKT